MTAKRSRCAILLLVFSILLTSAKAQDVAPPPPPPPDQTGTDPVVTDPPPEPVGGDTTGTASTASSASSASSSTVGASGSGSSVPGASDILNFQTDLFTGRFSYSIPIAVAPARQGTAPNPALTYNSSIGNGWCGVGWSLDIGYIERDTKKHVPVKWSGADALSEYDDGGGFIFNLGGVSGSLVNVGGDEYRNEIDSTFLKFLRKDNYYWEVTDKSGSKFLFGATWDSRMENTRVGWTTNLSKGTFRWALNRVVDANGNETSIIYTNFDGFLYPYQILYNGNTNSQPITADHRLTFFLEDRDDKPISFRSNYRVQLTKRLSSVSIKVNGNRLRRYALSYIPSPSTFRSLLSTVTVYGPTDDDSLPPLTFTYQVKPFEFESAVSWVVNNQASGEDYAGISTAFEDVETQIISTPVRLQDIDGDGLPERIMPTTGPVYDRFYAQRNNGGNFESTLKGWGPLTSQNQTAWDWGGLDRSGVELQPLYRVTTIMFTDINGDGYPDRVEKNLSGSDWLIETNKGLAGALASFYAYANWGPVQYESPSIDPWYGITATISPAPNGSTFVDFLDMTGDGLPDRVMRKESAPYSYFVVQQNTGTGFLPWRKWGTLVSQNQNDNMHWSSPSAVYIERDETDGWTDNTTFAMLADINGDGLADRVLRKFSPPFDYFQVQFNNGAGFSGPESPWGPIDGQGGTATSWYCPYATHAVDSSLSYTVQCTLLDINGDGLPDRVMRSRSSPYDYFQVQFNTGSGFTALYPFGPLSSQAYWYWRSPSYVEVQGGTDEKPDLHNITKVDLIDVNGDGLPDRIYWASTSGWWIQLNKGPFPDLLSKINNGIGGKVDITYTPSTKFNNRDKLLTTGDPWADGAKALLPFVIYVVETVATRDGFGNTNLTTYSYRGGMWDNKRREFRGFQRTKITDSLGTTKFVYFHQGGGMDDSSLGEYHDATSVAKKGIPFRIEVIGTNGLLYNLTLNKVEEIALHANGWCFPFISQTITMDYEGLSNYRATAQQFQYDSATGNILKVSNLGEVTSVDAATHTFTDSPNDDSIYTHTIYAALGEILNRPSTNKVTSDSAGANKLRETLFTYDSRGNLTNQQVWLSNSVYITSASITYDQYGNPLRITDAVGITITNTYDQTYQMFVEQTVTGGFTNQFRYDPISGVLLLSIDPKGLVSSNNYDVFFRPTETLISTAPYATPTLWRERYSYNLGGTSGNFSYNYVRSQINDAVDPVNGHETYVYADGLGRPIQTRVESEVNGFRVTDQFYDERGSPLFATLGRFSSGAGFTIVTGTRLGTYTEYDPIGRAYKVTPAVQAVFDSNGALTDDLTATGGDTGSPLGSTIVQFKDGSTLWATVVTDPEGKIKKYYEDAYGRIIQIAEVTGGGNYNTYFKFDLLGNLTNVTDHALNVTQIAYDNLGRKTSMSDPDMGTWSYAYDSANRLVQQIDAKGQKLVFVYTDDPLGRLTARNIYNSNGVLAATSTYVYDSNQGDPTYPVFKGDLFKVTDREGWTKLGYDARGRAIISSRHLNTNATTYTAQFAYDDADRLQLLTYPGASVNQIKYEHDTAGHINRVYGYSGAAANETFYSLPQFNELGQLTSVKYGTNQQIAFQFYSNSKRLKNKVATATTGLQNLTYEYDKVSNLKKLTDGVRISGPGSATLSSLSYDDLHRLTAVTSTALGTRSYSYDPIGNVLINGDSGTGTYSYSANKAHATSGANGKNYDYDACGNMTMRDIQTLEYDEENRLVRVYCPSPMITFGYADGGTRLWRNSSYAGLTVWIGDSYEVRDGKELCHVVVDGQLIATFEAARPPGSVFYYYLQDHLDSSNILTDTNGILVQQYEYTAYGTTRLTNNPGAFAITHRYTSQPFDSETGLYFYQSRYYDAELGRFTQPDPIGPSLDNPQTLNRYTYALNNPEKFMDPSGYIEEGPMWDTYPPAYVIEINTYQFSYEPSYHQNPYAGSDVQFPAAVSDYYYPVGVLNALPSATAPAGLGINLYLDVNVAMNGAETPHFSFSSFERPEPEPETAWHVTFNAPLPPADIHANFVDPKWVGTAFAPGLADMPQDLIFTALTAGGGGLARGAGFLGSFRSNARLIQQVTTRAENAVGGVGRFAGTAKHTYARRLLDKYQGIYGNQGLVTESSWLNGRKVDYGTKGSKRLDVLDVNVNLNYDWKFTVSPPGLSPSRAQMLTHHGPPGLRVIEINP